MSICHILCVYPVTFKSYLKSVMCEVRHDDDNVITTANAGLHCNDVRLTTVYCK